MSASAAILLFSYLGVESAAVSAGEVKNPRRNVGRATVIGTAGAALVYLLGTVSVFGTVAHDRLVESTAPFSDAVNAMFGGSWGGWAVALAALISMTGCLNGWTLLSAQTPYAAAQDGLFPAVFARKRRGVPTVGVAVTVVLFFYPRRPRDQSGSPEERVALLIYVRIFFVAVPLVDRFRLKNQSDLLKEVVPLLIRIQNNILVVPPVSTCAERNKYLTRPLPLC